MALKADLKHFLDEEGKVLALTEQAETVFKFLSEIVMSVSKHIKQPLIEIDLVAVDLKCNTRAEQLTCDGNIEARCISTRVIEWHCDTCEAVGTISNWQGSMWDKQQHTIH
ncbi:hypothetical protein [Colwellia sp. C1TZA3]|uniref:hypothetical protein n=1 Tax=Colwellia sp. C1TZA3 TaxID=2508879 RepID=UPI0011B97CFB|nr:hypothetical protein [Colwellia sp. C1TZA3]TWX72675.1 hypothetical protein ESZ39_07855 [Colwellia sp. C1TZA3]